MDRTRLKNIIILILVLGNLFLLGSIGWRLSQERTARDRMLRELTERFSAQNIALSAALPQQQPPAGQALTRSIEHDAALARALLGEPVVGEDLGGGIYRYFSGRGQGSFRANGSFEITGELCDADVEDFCRKLCQDFGFRSFSMELDAENSGIGSAMQTYGGLPVVNAVAAFQLEQGRLTAVRGTLLPAAAVEEGSSTMTAVTALATFLEDCRTTGVVLSAVTDIALCYELQSTTSSPMMLSPAWLITTDTGSFCVSCLTGQVSRI